MYVNNEQTKTKILEIAGELRSLAHNARNFKKHTVAVQSDETMSEPYKKSKIEDMRASYEKTLNEKKAKIVELLNDIIPLVEENEAVYNLDIPDFANTMAIITASEGKLDPKLMDGIKLKFAGHYQALQAIKAAFERYEVELSKYGYDEYICPVGFAIPTLITAAENIEREETSVFIDLMDIFKKIIRFGEVRGIEFSEDAKTFGDGFDEEAGALFARRVMGLPEEQ